MAKTGRFEFVWCMKGSVDGAETIAEMIDDLLAQVIALEDMQRHGVWLGDAIDGDWAFLYTDDVQVRAHFRFVETKHDEDDEDNLYVDQTW